MRERPILFSGPMVRAILDGRKTQTRWFGCFTGDCPHETQGECDAARLEICPYGVPGDRLWVRETWFQYADGEWLYKADEGQPGFENIGFNKRWRPSLLMPRKASRITLEITGVRVERLQEISPADARAEGIASVEFTEAQERRVCQRRSAAQFHGKPELVNDMDYAAVQKYAVLWDSINGEKHPWASNPWVWVVEFRRSA